MKLSGSVLFFVFSFMMMPGHAWTQKSEPDYFLFDKDGEPVGKFEHAIFFGIRQKLSDTAWEWKYYNIAGPLIAVETYRDGEMTIPHGFFAWYDSRGIIDSSGFTNRGRKDSSWYYWTDSLTVWKKEIFANGKLIRTVDEQTLKAEREASTSRVFELVEKEADFPGGIKAWVKYLEKNLTFPKRAENLQKDGTVVVSFKVNTSGNLEDIRIAISREYSLDEEALRLIRNSPGWEPAVQGDKNVNAYRRQPITFALQ